MHGLFLQRAEQVNAVLTEHYPVKQLSQLDAEYRAALSAALAASPAPPVNEKVVALTALVREAAAQVSEDFKKVELWICLKTPPISDGNNFGAEVQNCRSRDSSPRLAPAEPGSSSSEDLAVPARNLD